MKIFLLVLCAVAFLCTVTLALAQVRQTSATLKISCDSSGGLKVETVPMPK